MFEHMRLKHQVSMFEHIFTYRLQVWNAEMQFCKAQSGMSKIGCFCVAALHLVDKRVQAPQTYSVLSAINYYLRLRTTSLSVAAKWLHLNALRDGVCLLFCFHFCHVAERESKAVN
jgi:hypothetical protein